MEDSESGFSSGCDPSTSATSLGWKPQGCMYVCRNYVYIPYHMFLFMLLWIGGPCAVERRDVVELRELLLKDLFSGVQHDVATLRG